MKKLHDFIKLRNQALPEDLKPILSDLQNIFQKNILSAGVLQPGYFNDFYPILEVYRQRNIISRYHLSEEEHIVDNNFLKVPVIDIMRPNQQSNTRIFLSPL